MSSTSAEGVRLSRGVRGHAPPENFEIRASEITGNAFISINPKKILSNFYHHSVSFLHKNVHLNHNYSMI